MTETVQAPGKFVYDPDASPVLLSPLAAESSTEAELRELLHSLQRLAHATANLKAERDKRLGRAVELSKALGRPVMLNNPITFEPAIATVREDEVLEVDLELLKTMVPREVWRSVLKPEQVDTKDGGLFQQAVARGDISAKVFARVGRLVKKAPWIMFTNPQRKA